MSLFTAALYPGRGLGILVLGASLHDILTRLKAEPQAFPKLDLIYSPSDPVKDPVILNLPNNGIRLRFDGPEQRLRLIEVLDFSKNRLTYKGNDVAKEQYVTFRHVYHKLLGPTFPGEFIPGDEKGTYVLSYPGIAFSFPLLNSAWPPEKDFVSLLSSSATQPAASMAVFVGDSWAEARGELYTRAFEERKAREVPDEIKVVKIKKNKLELVRENSFCLILGETTPQELVAELGPPDAIYRKNDQRMAIHGETSRRQSMSSTDTESAPSDDSDVEDVVETGECFYNYFYHGFDVLIGTVATKVVLHGNIPGSYSFNRHRRCRWELDGVNSETPFEEIAKKLGGQQRGMVLNRGWGDSPGSSVELLGGWESEKRDDDGLGNTTLYGFPDLVFEVLKNGTVSGLTVF